MNWREHIRSLTDRQRLKALDAVIELLQHCGAAIRSGDRSFDISISGVGVQIGREDSSIDPPHVVIDGVRYVPAGEVPPLTDERLKRALSSLTEIQYFNDQEHKHRAWAWDALNALAPQVAEMASQDAQAAFDFVRELEET